MRAALAGRLGSEERADAAQAAASIEARRGNLRSAIQLLDTAGRTDEAVALARRYIVLPTLRRTFEDQIAVRDIVTRADPESVLSRLMHLECQWGELSTSTDHQRLPRELAALAQDALEVGDDELEATALIRSMQGDFLERAAADDESLERLTVLAARLPFAAQVVPFLLAERAMYRGDVAASLGHVADTAPGDPVLDVVLRAKHMCCIGRPEQVARGVGVSDLSQMPPGEEMYVALAMWLRAEVTPSAGLPIALSMAATIVGRRVVHPSITMLGITALIAVEAGDTATAQRSIAEAEQLARWGCAPQIRAFIAVAAAGIALVEHGDDAALVELDSLMALAPLETWPPLAHLLTLPMIYALRPETRARLDACELGTALTVAMNAGRALVAFREHGDLAPAGALPWHEEALLRVHVLPPHLCELAAAAGAVGVVAADRMLLDTPHARRMLRRIAARPATSDHVQALLARLPAQPEGSVEVEVLGGLRLLRDGEQVVDADWERRNRVQELLALLVEERRLPRARAAATLWPDLDEEKSVANLRVTLTYLQRVLEPERDRYDTPFYVRADGAFLVLADEVMIDADVFEAELARARDHDRGGAPRVALRLYQEALTRYRGDYLAHIDAEWASMTRARLRFLAVNGLCRIGELLLARGEPEEAGAWALHARRLAPLNERAGRLSLACQLGAGDRAGAALELRALVASLSSEGLEPEPETLSLSRRLFA